LSLSSPVPFFFAAGPSLRASFSFETDSTRIFPQTKPRLSRFPPPLHRKRASFRNCHLLHPVMPAPPKSFRPEAPPDVVRSLASRPDRRLSTIPNIPMWPLFPAVLRPTASRIFPSPHSPALSCDALNLFPTIESPLLSAILRSQVVYTPHPSGSKLLHPFYYSPAIDPQSLPLLVRFNAHSQ